MKKVFILTLAALAMSALSVSCQKSLEETAPAEEPVLRTFTCKIASPDPDSKVSINESTGKTAWEVGDEILIHGEYTKSPYSATVTLTSENISADGKTATFTLSGVTEYDRTSSGYSSTLYAAYPADAVLADNHCYWNTRFSSPNNPLMVGYNNGDTFVLYNICGVLSFVVDGDFDSYTLVGNNDETVGYSALQSRIRLTTSGTENVDGFPVREGTGDGYTTVALTSVSGSVTADGSTTNRIYIPGGVNFTGGFTIRFKKSGSIVKTLSTNTAVNLAYGKYLPLGDVTSYLKTYVAPTSHDSSISMSGATDLSASASANCYIVDGSDASNAGKVFTFKAYKGKSTTSVGTIGSVAVLWETYNNAETVTANTVIADVDYDKQDANDYYTIVFQMPASLHAGNAVIAAKDNSDNILWSWHIWVPETTVTDINDATFAGSAIMDRNLGAIVVTPTTAITVKSYGMYYQWGRKDPFPGAVTASVSFGKVDGAQSTDYSIKNPTTFINVEESDSYGNWNEEDISTLWDNGGVKGLYDPCPPGYKVPVFNTSYTLWVKSGAGWTFDYTNYYFKADAADPVFPLAGYCTGSASVSYAGTRALIWSASAYSTPRGSNKIIRQDKGGYYYYNYFKVEAGSVRCVVE